MILGPNTPLEKELKKEIIRDLICLPKKIRQSYKYNLTRRNQEIGSEVKKIAVKISALIVVK